MAWISGAGSELEPHDARSIRVLGIVPLGWTLAAVVAQVILTAVLVPRLPATIELHVVGAVSSGPGHYRVAVDGLVLTMWILLAVLALVSVGLALLAAVGRSTPVTSAAAAVVACLIPTGLGLLVASVLPQVGASAPAEVGTSGGGGSAWATVGLVVGLALGLVSVLALPQKVRGRNAARSQP
ncbi:hypothetical protein C6I20_16065 [Aeromicrobium sp. A1-2]|uniref:hypothetical protein n=1 Tax=Aeromicrobium sp. A1-2 TaxID=2107713 RepID=UPI000E4BF4EE|nr:hypothetical protein [Aeromicrobium sp. A1-2]AXT86536.1 hypothetical protein C6I20_16065 [Aeromicrobium sp. A1-2]